MGKWSVLIPCPFLFFAPQTMTLSQSRSTILDIQMILNDQFFPEYTTVNGGKCETIADAKRHLLYIEARIDTTRSKRDFDYWNTKAQELATLIAAAEDQGSLTL